MTTRQMLSAVASVSAAAILTAAAQGPARADDQFGDHVRTCAQMGMFSGTHNPGMHQGYAGWSPDHTC